MSARVLGSGAAAVVLSSILTAAAAQTPRKASARTNAPPAASVDTGSKALPSTSVPQCASGLVLIPASLAKPSDASPAANAVGAVSAVRSIPSPTGLLVGAAKNRLLKKGDSAPPSLPAPAASPGTAPSSLFVCVTPARAQAFLQAAQTASGSTAPPSPEQGVAAQKDAMKSAVASALAVTPQGMLVSGAVAAAPTAGRAVKSLAGRFGRGGESKESMVRDLQRGRLQVKGIRFVPGSDEMAEGFEQSIALLADALQSVDGQYALVVLAESDGKSPPDTETARRRMAKLAAHLQLAGVGPDRLVVADDAIGVRTPGGRTLDAHVAASKAPKPGDARVEIVRVKGANP